VINASNIANITAKICYTVPFYINGSIVKLVWLNESGMWEEFSNYTVDIEKNCVTFYIDHETRPTIEQLVGTPIGITGPFNPLGGEVKLMSVNEERKPLTLTSLICTVTITIIAGVAVVSYKVRKHLT